MWFGLLLTLMVAMRLTDAPALARRRAAIVLGVGLLQGVLGYVQYFTGLPIVAVAFHVLGACLFIVAVTRLLLALSERAPAPSVPLHA